MLKVKHIFEIINRITNQVKINRKFKKKIVILNSTKICKSVPKSQSGNVTHAQKLELIHLYMLEVFTNIKRVCFHIISTFVHTFIEN